MPGMRDAGGGAIVNVSSYAADTGAATEAPYAVSKGGLNVLTRTCAREGGSFGIRANTVTAGVIRDTKFVADHPELLGRAVADAPLGSYPSAAEVAEVIGFLVSDRARHITGENVYVTAGAYMKG
jgi:NAD(P)-dependent dehydrogenase (short-subunit alcohol dehydrogenase family)